MDTQVIHIEERTPPHCSVELYSVMFNGTTLLECMSLDEVKEVTLGELFKYYYEED